MEIIIDEKGRKLADKVGGSIDENASIYVVVKRWAGRTRETVPMTLSQAKGKFDLLSKTANHGIWIEERITLGSIV